MFHVERLCMVAITLYATKVITVHMGKNSNTIASLPAQKSLIVRKQEKESYDLTAPCERANIPFLPARTRTIADEINRLNIASELKYLMTLQAVNALRVSEICETRSMMQREENKVILWSSKQKKWKLVDDPQIYGYYFLYFVKDAAFGYDVNRFYIYRLLREVVKQNTLFRRKNSAITHIYRYILAEDMYARDYTIEQIKAALLDSSDTAIASYLANICT